MGLVGIFKKNKKKIVPLLKIRMLVQTGEEI